MRIISNSGQRFKTVFSPTVDTKTGRLTLQETGKVDLYAEIQSHKDSVDIHTLIARYRNGETDVFMQRPGFYGDITEMPKTYAEMYDIMVKAENSFNALPVDVRRQFDFDFGVYLASLGNFDKTLPTVESDSPESREEYSEKEVKSE